MNKLTIFENNEFGKIRTISIDNEPYFVGKDVAEILGYVNASKAVITHVDDEDKKFIMLDIADSRNGNVPNGQSKTAFINESGLYSLILSSKLPAAKSFKRWVTSEVLPTIRKTGGYNLPKTYSEALRALADVEEEKERLLIENSIMQPKADYFDELVDRKLLTNFRDTAKELKIKEKEFISFLINNKFVYRDSKGKIKPYADKNNGLFEIKECYGQNNKWVGNQTLITPKGRETFRLLLKI